MELSQCLAALGESIGSLSQNGTLSILGSRSQQRKSVNELRKFVAEAEVEPNLWFVPFSSACYNKLLGSLSRVVDLLWFGEHALKFLQQEFLECKKEDVNMVLLDGELGHVKELICSSIKSVEEKICRTKLVEKKKNVSCDLEAGKSNESIGEESSSSMSSFLQQCRNVVDNVYSNEDEKEKKSQVVLSLAALGFCLSAYTGDDTN
ncbi:hypothetical protein VNO78_14233 [Psophocarpus tetragonolobus]|uniref:Uncharacterized protein n=1 Tax=Psophocarpus tetragonolobus TaxID=3891 RepID=A0AAN9SPX0_PSOTE